jgi:hypothetical protein
MGANRKTYLTSRWVSNRWWAGCRLDLLLPTPLRAAFMWNRDNSARVTPLGQLPFFIEYLKQGGLFDGWAADYPMHYTSPNAPTKRDFLGTVMLSVLAGHWRYAHITTLRCDLVNAADVGNG